MRRFTTLAVSGILALAAVAAPPAAQPTAAAAKAWTSPCPPPWYKAICTTNPTTTVRGAAAITNSYCEESTLSCLFVTDNNDRFGVSLPPGFVMKYQGVNAKIDDMAVIKAMLTLRGKSEPNMSSWYVSVSPTYAAKLATVGVTPKELLAWLYAKTPPSERAPWIPGSANAPPGIVKSVAEAVHLAQKPHYAPPPAARPTAAAAKAWTSPCPPPWRVSLCTTNPTITAPGVVAIVESGCVSNRCGFITNNNGRFLVILPAGFVEKYQGTDAPKFDDMAVIKAMLTLHNTLNLSGLTTELLSIAPSYAAKLATVGVTPGELLAWLYTNVPPSERAPWIPGSANAPPGIVKSVAEAVHPAPKPHYAPPPKPGPAYPTVPRPANGVTTHHAPVSERCHHTPRRFTR
jgi:hypothetical protein